jgi:antitoxin MazE
METTLDIRKWGNSLGVRLPSAIAKEAGLKLNQKIRITVEDKKLIVTPASEPLTLEQKLALFNPDKHGGEQMQASSTLGAEIW